MSVRTRCAIRELSVSLDTTVGGTGHSTRFRRGCELELITADGIVGRGEASPLPRFSSESYEQAHAELGAIGALDLEFPAIASECGEFVGQVVSRTGCTLPSTRFALEGALLDLVAQRFQLPLANLIRDISGQAPGAPSRVAAEIDLSTVVTARDLPVLLTSARHAVAQGFRTLKFKLGPATDFERELGWVQALRMSLDASIRLRLDPNQAWTARQLPRMLSQLVALAPEFVEEPAAFADLLQLGHSPVPLAIDESLRDDLTLEILAEHRGRLNLSALVIKPALLGLMRAITFAEYGRSLGLDIVVTHLFDGPIGLATAGSLALALGSRQTAQGLAPHVGLRLSPTRRVLGITAGKLELVQQPGLPLSTVEGATC